MSWLCNISSVTLQGICEGQDTQEQALVLEEETIIHLCQSQVCYTLPLPSLRATQNHTKSTSSWTQVKVVLFIPFKFVRFLLNSDEHVCVIRNCICHRLYWKSGKEEKMLRMQQGIFTKEEVTEAHN